MNEIDIRIGESASRFVALHGYINGKWVNKNESFIENDQESFFNAVRNVVDYAIHSSRVPEPGDIVTLSCNYLFSEEGVGRAIRWAASRSDKEISRLCLAKLKVYDKPIQDEPYEVIFADEEFTAITRDKEVNIVLIVPTNCLK